MAMIDLYSTCKSFVIDNSKNADAAGMSSRQRLVLSTMIGFKINGLYARYNDIDFILDTGAVMTCLPARLLGFKSIEGFKKYFKDSKKYAFSGIHKTAKLDYYEVYVDLSFKGTDYILQEVPIYLSFDPNAQMALFGMSLLGLFKLEIDPISCTVRFTETPALKGYRTEGIPLRDPLKIDYNMPLDILNMVDESTLEANYINKAIEAQEKPTVSPSN